MKKIFYIGIVLISLLSQTSCSGFLDEDLRGKLPVEGGLLTTQVGLESALTGAYRGWTWTWVYGFTNSWATEMTLGGDDITCIPGLGNTQEFDRLAVKSTNSSSAPVFWGAYKAIQGANNIILNYKTTVGDDNVIKVMAGEAHFIRAISYFWLARCYGDVPLVTTATFSADQLSAGTTPVAEIYKLIVDDLQKAETMLGNSRRNGQAGRPNVGSAKALLAEVYLQMAGWPLKDTGKYALAAEKAKEVIDNRALYGFDLVKDFSVLYKNDERESGITTESVMVIPTNKNNEDTANAFYGFWAYPAEIGGWDVCFSELNFYNDFPEGPRKDATFATTFKTDKGVEYFWKDLTTGHPYYRKLMKDPNAPGFYEYKSSIPISWLRYTQTVLTYAEASARATGTVNSQAAGLMKDIRDRAGLPAYPNMSAADFAKAVVQERAWELCGERVRWFDMVRLEIVAEVFAKRSDKDNPPIGDPASSVNYTFPIPEHDLLLNANLNKKPSGLR